MRNHSQSIKVRKFGTAIYVHVEPPQSKAGGAPYIEKTSLTTVARNADVHWLILSLFSRDFDYRINPYRAAFFWKTPFLRIKPVFVQKTFLFGQIKQIQKKNPKVIMFGIRRFCLLVRISGLQYSNALHAFPKKNISGGALLLLEGTLYAVEVHSKTAVGAFDMDMRNFYFRVHFSSHFHFAHRVEEELRFLSDTTDGDSASKRTLARRSFFRRKKHQRSSSRDSKDVSSFSSTQLSWFSDSGILGEDGTMASYQRVERLDCK